MRAEDALQGAGTRAETLVDLLLARAQEPSKVAATHKSDGEWRDATWGEILERVKKVSAGLTASGVRPGDRVAIFAAKSDWSAPCSSRWWSSTRRRLRARKSRLAIWSARETSWEARPTPHLAREWLRSKPTILAASSTLRAPPATRRASF